MELKHKVFELLKEKGQINITEFINLLPEINGKYAMYLPVKDGGNEKILLLSNITKEFVDAYNELVYVDKVVGIKPVHISSFIFDGSPIYNLQICKERHFKKQTHCWLPIALVCTNQNEELQSLNEIESLWKKIQCNPHPQS